jgi:hypothetical protein
VRRVFASWRSPAKHNNESSTNVSEPPPLPVKRGNRTHSTRSFVLLALRGSRAKPGLAQSLDNKEILGEILVKNVDFSKYLIFYPTKKSRAFSKTRDHIHLQQALHACRNCSKITYRLSLFRSPLSRYRPEQQSSG